MSFASNYNIDMKDKIMNMSNDKRKQLGINKSTLHYMKKNLQQNKRIKIYNKVLAKIS